MFWLPTLTFFKVGSHHNWQFLFFKNCAEVTDATKIWRKPLYFDSLSLKHRVYNSEFLTQSPTTIKYLLWTNCFILEGFLLFIEKNDLVAHW